MPNLGLAPTLRKGARIDGDRSSFLFLREASFSSCPLVIFCFTEFRESHIWGMLCSYPCPLHSVWLIANRFSLSASLNSPVPCHLHVSVETEAWDDINPKLG